MGKPMLVVGLTGGIACGKSTVTRIVRAQGIPVWDADRAVHIAYQLDFAFIARLAERYPDCVNNRGSSVDRQIVGGHVLGNVDELAWLSEALKPGLELSRKAFLDETQEAGETIVVLDVPLLFESGLDAECDITITVSCPGPIQRERALRRGMTTQMFEAFLAGQTSDADRRSRATFIVDSNQPMIDMEADVIEIIADLKDAAGLAS